MGFSATARGWAGSAIHSNIFLLSHPFNFCLTLAHALLIPRPIEGSLLRPGEVGGSQNKGGRDWPACLPPPSLISHLAPSHSPSPPDHPSVTCPSQGSSLPQRLTDPLSCGACPEPGDIWGETSGIDNLLSWMLFERR